MKIIVDEWTFDVIPFSKEGNILMRFELINDNLKIGDQMDYIKKWISNVSFSNPPLLVYKKDVEFIGVFGRGQIKGCFPRLENPDRVIFLADSYFYE